MATLAEGADGQLRRRRTGPAQARVGGVDQDELWRRGPKENCEL